MSNIAEKFRIARGDKFRLKDMSTDDTLDFKKEDAKEILKDLIHQTTVRQDELYAENRYSLLIIFQAMDAAGKDSAIEHTMSGLNPQGCQVFSFKQPSTEELDHDFLWRHYRALPERGRIGIHNRSHYENVLVSKVHPELLLHENLPRISSVRDVDEHFWNHRYDSIRCFEKHLSRNGMIIIKFFLYLSKKEQRKRFLKRIDDSQKNWKFSAADLKERACWDEYMDAYEKAIQETATEHCPWYVVPADKKWFTRIAISNIILDTIKSLKLKYPELPESERGKLAEIKQQLEGE